MSAVIGALRVNLGLDSAVFSTNLKKANKDMKAFSKRAGIAIAAGVAAFTAGMTLMAKQSLTAIDAQAKLAASMNTTTQSIQVMERAGELSGVAFKGIEASVIQLTTRLGQAAAGFGPAAKSLKRMGLSAEELAALPLDERIAKINKAISDYIPKAQQAAVAGELFGQRNGVAMLRINPETISLAADDIERFGVAVSEVDAKQIERTNDALSRIKLISTGLSNQLAVHLAPTLEAIAKGFAAISEVGGPVNTAFKALLDNLGRIVAYIATAAAGFGASLAAGMAFAALRTLTLAKAFVVLRYAIARTGIGILLVGAGELVYQFARLVKATGGFGEALTLVKDVGVEVWGRLGLKFDAFKLHFESGTLRIKGWWLDAIHEMAMKWGEFIAKIGPTFNRVSERLKLDVRVDNIDVLTWASAMEDASTNAGYLAQDAKDAAIWLDGLAGGPLKSVEAIREALKGSAEEIATSWGRDVPDAVVGGLGTMSEAAKKMAETIGSMVDGWSQAFGKWVVDGFKDFKGFASSVIDTFKNMLVQMIAMAAKNKIMIALGLGGSTVGGAASAATSGGGLLAGIGGTFLGGFGSAATAGSAAVAGTGLLGGLGGVGAGISSGFAASGIGGAISGGFGAVGAGISGGLAAGGVAGIGAAIGAALPVIGIGLALFSLFKKKPAISAADFAKIQTGLKLSGVEMLSTGSAGKKAAAHLKKLAGGIENFTKNTQFYFDNFFTDSEKRARGLEALTKTFDKLNFQMPTTARGFRDIVEGLDLTSEKGRIAYDSMLKVAPVFTQVFGSIASAGASLQSQFGEDVFSTREEMQSTLAALNRGATIGSLAGGSGVINPRELLTISEQNDKRQSEISAASMASASGITRLFNLMQRWDIDGMPPEQTA